MMEGLLKTLSADPVRSLMVSMPDDVVDAALLALDDDDFLTRFRAEFGACESHGAFPLNALHEGRVVWFADCCPACNRQAVADRMLRDADIPLILANASFASYLTPTVEQQRVLGAVRAYADAFCADIRYGSSSRLLFGNSGTGKNHLMVSLAKQLMSKGHTVKVVTATDLLERLWSLEFRERSTWLKGLVKLSLLVIDELDKAPQSDAAQNGLFRVIDARHPLICQGGFWPSRTPLCNKIDVHFEILLRNRAGCFRGRAPPVNKAAMHPKTFR